MSSVTAASKTVLCVDDDGEALNLMNEVLAGYDMVFATTALDAIRHINSRGFDLYLLDQWLPDWSGTQLCREVRRVDPHGPVFFCTAAARETDRNRALRAGASAYLTKPVDPKVLREQIRVVLQLADLESIRAKVEAELALQQELERGYALCIRMPERARDWPPPALARSARLKACNAFFSARGTRAHFERGWPRMLSSAIARFSSEEMRRSAVFTLAETADSSIATPARST